MDSLVGNKHSSNTCAIISSVETANNLLIYKQFDKCLKLCTEQLIIVRRQTENISCEDVREALSLITIQAYAELNRWQEVLPFVTNLYTTLEDVPAKVIQLCILLHASMKDYPTCVALANVWLRNPHNCSPELQDAYLETIDIYVGHVLIPAHRWDEMQPFLESCPGLNPKRKDHFLKVIKELRHQVEQLKVEQIEVAADEATNESTIDERGVENLKPLNKSKAVSESSSFTAFVHRMSQLISKQVPVVTLYIIKHFTIIALLMYILISRADIDVLSWQSLGNLWILIAKLWKRMFAPFHEAKT